MATRAFVERLRASGPWGGTGRRRPSHGTPLSAISVGFESCLVNLSPPAEVPEKLHLLVIQAGSESDVPHEYDTGEAAWTVSDDGAAVELLGNTCAAATSGAYESIRFEFGCVELPPASPHRPWYRAGLLWPSPLRWATPEVGGARPARGAFRAVIRGETRNLSTWRAL